MAVASFQSAAIVYREEQNFDWRAYALLIAGETMFWAALFWKVYTHPQPAVLLNHHGLELAVAIAICVAAPNRNPLPRRRPPHQKRTKCIAAKMAAHCAEARRRRD